MDVSVLAILGAGAAVIGGMAYAMLPRDEDYFERSMEDLLDLTTASGPPYAAPLAGGLQNTAEHHLPDSGFRSDMECSASPPPIIGSDRSLLSGPESGGRAVQPIPPEGAPVFLAEFDDCETAGGPTVRSRPVLFRVK